MRFKFFLLIISLGIIILLIRTYIKRNTTIPNRTASKSEDVIFFSGNKIFTANNPPLDAVFPDDKTIILNRAKRELTFPARIRKTDGKVLFFINLKGYYWLDENAALISEVSLTDFQNALAYLDWKILDMWRGNNLSDKSRTTDVRITITQQENTQDVEVWNALLISDSEKKSLPLQRLIFAGDPILDNAIISNPSHSTSFLPDCSSCPLLPTEKELISKQYARTYLTLNEKSLSIFDKNKPVKITVYLPH